MRNIMSSDEELIKNLGLSKELTECPYTGGRIYNDHEWDWLIHVFPPENNQYLHYFLLYDLPFNSGIPPIFSATKCARISLISPDYIHCPDCSKKEWILTYEEKGHLCKLLKDKFIWECLISIYNSEYENTTGKRVDFEFVRQDYMQLPE